MARPAKSVEVRKVSVRRAAPDAVGRTSSAFTATVELAAPGCVVEFDIHAPCGEKPSVVGLRVAGAAVTSSMLRAIPVDYIVRLVVTDVQASTSVAGAPSSDDAPPEVQAAALYREALTACSSAPTEFVAAAMGRSRSQVSRYLRSARANGLL